jgi:hypothetical protein
MVAKLRHRRIIAFDRSLRSGVGVTWQRHGELPCVPLTSSDLVNIYALGLRIKSLSLFRARYFSDF